MAPVGILEGRPSGQGCPSRPSSACCLQVERGRGVLAPGAERASGLRTHSSGVLSDLPAAWSAGEAGPGEGGGRAGGGLRGSADSGPGGPSAGVFCVLEVFLIELETGRGSHANPRPKTTCVSYQTARSTAQPLLWVWVQMPPGCGAGGARARGAGGVQVARNLNVRGSRSLDHLRKKGTLSESGSYVLFRHCRPRLHGTGHGSGADSETSRIYNRGSPTWQEECSPPIHASGCPL